MSAADLHTASTSRLEEVAALTAELAALSRAGLPLEVGLSAGGLRRLQGRIAERLRHGASLETALAAEGNALPPAFRAVVAAGLRSGRLAEAVETVGRSATMLAELRRRLAVASIYPAVIVSFACLIAAVILPRTLSILDRTIADFTKSPPPWHPVVRWLDAAGPWLLLVPPALVLLLVWTGGLSGLTMRLPGLHLALRSYRLSVFAELAAGLLDHGTPLDEALTLAADGSGDRRLRAEAAEAAALARSGAPPAKIVAAFRSMPRFARWLIDAAAEQGQLSPGLRQAADWSARRAAYRADLFRMTAPVVVTLAVGGTTVAAMAALTFGPTVELLKRAASEVSP